MKNLGKIKDRYEFSFDSRKLVLILFGAGTISALVFVLGVSVGVQWEAKRAEKAETAFAASTAGPKNSEAAPSAPDAGGQTVAPPAAPPVEPPPAETAAPTKDAEVEKPADTAADLTFPDVLNSSNKKTEPLTQPKKPRAATANYTVQVGAFDSRDGAQSSVDKLKKKDYDSRMFVSADKKDKYPYKVRVGSYGTREEATAVAKKLGGLLKTTPYVTAE